MIALGMHVDDVAIYVLWWTPIVFIWYLFHKTSLTKVYGWKNLTVGVLLGYMHFPVMFGVKHFGYADNYEQAIQDSEMNVEQYDKLKIRYGDKQADRESTPTPEPSEETNVITSFRSKSILKMLPNLLF